jgi:hypothetical protein
MKVLLLALFLLGTLAATARPGKAPEIVAQETKMVTHELESPTWERWITIKNPLDRAVWVFIECEHHLTVNPVGLAGRHTTTVTLPGHDFPIHMPDLAGRTSIHAYFNSKLAEACMGQNIPIVDVASALIADNGIVFDYYAEHGGTDHHLSFTTFRQQLHRAIEPLACVSIPQRIRLDITRRLFRRD